MTTTVALESDLVDAVKALTKEPTKTGAVRRAVLGFIRTQKLRDLAELAGAVDLRFNNTQIEDMERC